MNENEARADFLHEYLKDTPHLFALDHGKALSVKGNGREILLMWAMLSQHLCEMVGADDVGELNKMAVLASVDYLGDLVKELLDTEEG